MPFLTEARSPRALLDEVEDAREVLILTYTSALEYFERFALADARALGALVTVISDARMVHSDPVVVRRAGTQYLDARAMCPHGAFHPKLFVIAGDSQARIAIGSGNLTIAGWNANAEVWTVLRADADGGPQTIRLVAGFLRNLASSPVTLSPGAPEALLRVAERLDALPADDPGPTLLHSLHLPIAEQLPEQPVDELVLYAPFHDAALAGTRALLDRLQPHEWTVFVQPDTEVDGPALAELAAARNGRIAWVSRQATTDGKVIADERYWHGKVIQWRRGDTVWALTGSPNLSAPALQRAVAEGGNCELALLTHSGADLAPAEGEPGKGGIAMLSRTSASDEAWTPAVVLMSATVSSGAVILVLHKPLVVEATLQRYDIAADQWRRSATLRAGSDRYEVNFAAAPIGVAVRVLLGDETRSNSVFVTDLDRVRRAQVKAIGKARAMPADIARLGLGNQLLSDLDELRPHLLRVGASIATATASPDEEDAGGKIDTPAARPAPGISLEDYLAACDPVLGERATEFALVLPALPGVGDTLDDTVGTLDSDHDSDTHDHVEDGQREPTLAEQLRDSTETERERYRRFLERLVARAPDYPTVVRTLAVRSVLHAVASDLWDEECWPEILAGALCALGAPGDEPNDHERVAAASLAAVGLGLLRTDVERISRVDEYTMRYLNTGRAVAGLLGDASAEQIALLAADLPDDLSGTRGILAASHAIEETLHPLTGAERAVSLLVEEDEFAATALDGVIQLDDAIEGVPVPRLLHALTLAADPGPVYVRGRDQSGRTIIAAWCQPWLAIEQAASAGPVGRGWKLAPGQTPAMLEWEDLPKPTCSWFGGQPRPSEVTDLLGLIE